MSDDSEPSRSRRTLYNFIYDWLNNCELTQLDAIMVAMFVFIAGCGLILSLFAVQHIQGIFHRYFIARQPGPYHAAAPCESALSQQSAWARYYMPVTRSRAPHSTVLTQPAAYSRSQYVPYIPPVPLYQPAPPAVAGPSLYQQPPVMRQPGIPVPVLADQSRFGRPHSLPVGWPLSDFQSGKAEASINPVNTY